MSRTQFTQGKGPVTESVAPKQFQLGVLFVHGIGTQPSGDTLVRWGDALVKVIGRSTGEEVAVRIERGSLGSRPLDGPTQVEVLLRWEDCTERWLLAEAWWAQAFPAPTYRELVSWSFRALPLSIAVHIGQRYWQTAARKMSWGKVGTYLSALLQFLVALALLPVLLVLLALALVLGLLPIPQLRTFILSAQSALTATVGDSLAFIESPVRAGVIRTRILDQLARLKDVCENTIIVAHSQGAAVVLDALDGIVERLDEDDKPPEQPPLSARIVPDTLLTFGAGINQLVSLKVLLSRHLGLVAYAAGGAMVAALAGIAWLFAGVQSQRMSVSGILHAVAVIVVAFGGLALFISVTNRTAKWLAVRWHAARNLESWLMPLYIALCAGLGLYALYHRLPVEAVFMAGLALLMLGSACAFILSDHMASIVTAPVRKPPNLARWVDLHASADPVPNGPTRVSGANAIESVPIWNQGSVTSDHVTYWDNLDGFVLRVARVCAETADSAWIPALPVESKRVDERAAWRVSFLRVARWSTVLVWLFLLAWVCYRHGDSIPLPFDPPAWLPAVAVSLAQYAIMAALIIAAMWATLHILRWPWNLWVRAEQSETLLGGYPQGRSWFWLTAMTLIFSILLLSVVTLVLDDRYQILAAHAIFVDHFVANASSVQLKLEQQQQVILAGLARSYFLSFLTILSDWRMILFILACGLAPLSSTALNMLMPPPGRRSGLGSYLEGWKRYAVFRGRSTQQEFWEFALVGVIVFLALAIVLPGRLMEVLGPLYLLAILLPAVAVMVRRLHDTGRSGWWLGINLLPVVGTIAFVYFLADDSESSDNEYGPEPVAE